MATVRTLEVGDFAACCYIVAQDESPYKPAPCVVIDPGAEAARIAAAVSAEELSVEMVLLTHAHADHIGGVDAFLEFWPKAVLASSAETSRRACDPVLNLSAVMGRPIACRAATREFADGEEFTAAGMRWQAVELPGHEPGEMVYILNQTERVFTGDTIFAGSIGRSDFPGGDGRALITGIRHLLENLPANTCIHPGHGPSTSAGEELRHNPFLVGF